MLSNSLSLDDFRRIMGYHPFHFWGLSDSGKLKVTSACNDILYKYPWQSADAVGREDVLEAIRTAESRLAEHLNYHVAPSYLDQLVPWPKFYNTDMNRFGNHAADWRRVAIKLPRGHIQKIGLQRLDVIDDTVAVTLSDPDGDGVSDTFTLTAPTSVTDPEEIAVYFTAADRWDGSAAGDSWRVQPIQVSIAGGVATIVGRAWLITKPVHYEAIGAGPLDPSVVGILATILGVYRLWYDPNGIVTDESQGVLIWETAPCHGWWCCCSACSTITTTPASSSQDPAAEARAVARVGIRDARMGLVAPGESVMDAGTGIWRELCDVNCSGEPDRFRVRYLSGIALENHQMSKFWQTLTARMAAAELARPLCTCDKANRELYTWQFDLSRSRGANDEQFIIGMEDVRNPFGTRRGHVFAFKTVSRLALGQGIAV